MTDESIPPERNNPTPRSASSCSRMLASRMASIASTPIVLVRSQIYRRGLAPPHFLFDLSVGSQFQSLSRQNRSGLTTNGHGCRHPAKAGKNIFGTGVQPKVGTWGAATKLGRLMQTRSLLRSSRTPEDAPQIGPGPDAASRCTRPKQQWRTDLPNAEGPRQTPFADQRQPAWRCRCVMPQSGRTEIFCSSDVPRCAH